MASQNPSPDKDPVQEYHSMLFWGGLVGAAVGACLGLFVGHWIAWGLFMAVMGMIAGGLIDRARR